MNAKKHIDSAIVVIKISKGSYETLTEYDIEKLKKSFVCEVENRGAKGEVVTKEKMLNAILKLDLEANRFFNKTSKLE